MSLRLSGGRRLLSPPGDLARPTAARVRLAVMNLLADELPGCRWLDLCGGSGVMACEALQRGAREVVAVERDRRIAAVARANLEAVSRGGAARQGGKASSPPPGLHRPQGNPPGGEAAGFAPVKAEVVNEEVLRWLARGAEGSGRQPFDVIYADPPYAAALHAPIATAVETGGWLQPGGTLVWECASDALPPVPGGWQIRDLRRYGGSTVVLLEPAPKE